MKKKLSLLLVLAMAASAVPATSFAATTNRLSKTVSLKEDAVTDTSSFITFEDKGDLWGNVGEVGSTDKIPTILGNEVNTTTYANKYVATEEFTVTLTGAEFNYKEESGKTDIDDYADIVKDLTTDTAIDDGTHIAKVQRIGDKEAIITVVRISSTAAPSNGNDIKFPILATVKDEGEAKITVDSMNSAVSGGSYTFSTVSSGSVKATIEKSTDVDDQDTAIKEIVLTETTAGSLKVGDTIKLKLGGNFVFPGQEPTAIRVSGDKIDLKAKKIDKATDEIEFTVVEAGKETVEASNKNVKSTAAAKFTIGLGTGAGRTGLKISEDDASVGDEAEITVSGSNVTKTTLTVGKYVEYGYSWKAEDKDVPVLYSGRGNDDTDLLKVTFKELVDNSWLTDRKTTITLPEGVKFVSDNSVDESKLKNVSSITTEINTKDASVMELKAVDKKSSGKVEATFEFEVSVDPAFTGDIVATLSGAGVANEEMTAVIATVVAPVTVKVETTPVAIDYRNVAVGNITITEAYPGALEKGKVLRLSAEKMEFESGMEYEVTEGDIKIEDVTKTKGTIDIEVKSSSSKTASTIELSNLSVYLDRTLPVGDYALKVIAADDKDGASDSTKATDVHKGVGDNAFFYNYKAKAKSDTPAFFDTDSVTVAKNYITVKTAGRDQDDSTFTTKISVTVGESKMTADGKDVALEVPAFINADSRVMLPVRAVVEALSGTVAIKWDDASKTAFFSMGSRVFSMTVGNSSMTINGTSVTMTTAPVIVDSRIFIPLRDLGIALGLNDSKINWDDATKTASLN